MTDLQGKDNSMSLKIHPGTLASLAEIAAEFYSEYQLKKLFQVLGIRYAEQPNMSREALALSGLARVNNLEDLEKVLAPIADKRNYRGDFREHKAILERLSSILRLDDFDIEFEGSEPMLVPLETAPAGPAGIQKAEATQQAVRQHSESTSAVQRNKVFVVHGRDQQFASAMSNYLRSLGLEVVSWLDGVRLTDKPTPYLNEVIEAALGVAQAIVILMTPDNEARLREGLWDDNTSEVEKGQQFYPRQNVVYEAGMALGLARGRTIIVKPRDVVLATDLDGLNYQAFNGDADSRNQLASRLEIAGCTVSRTGDWLHSGVFPDYRDLRSPSSPAQVRSQAAQPLPASEAELTRRFSVQPTMLLTVGGSISGPQGHYLMCQLENVGRGVARDVRLKLPDLASGRVAAHILVGGKVTLRYRYDDKPCFMTLLGDKVVIVEFEDEFGNLYQQTGEVVQDLTPGGVIYSYGVSTIGPPTRISVRSVGV